MNYKAACKTFSAIAYDPLIRGMIQGIEGPLSEDFAKSTGTLGYVEIAEVEDWWDTCELLEMVMKGTELILPEDLDEIGPSHLIPIGVKRF